MQSSKRLERSTLNFELGTMKSKRACHLPAALQGVSFTALTTRQPFRSFNTPDGTVAEAVCADASGSTGNNMPSPMKLPPKRSRQLMSYFQAGCCMKQAGWLRRLRFSGTTNLKYWRGLVMDFNQSTVAPLQL